MRAGNSCKKSLSLREFSVRVLWVFLMIGCLVNSAGAVDFWDFTSVDSTGSAWGSTVAILPSGQPAIAYTVITNKNMKYAWYDGSVWHTTIVDTGYTGATKSLAILPSGNPAIAYYDENNDDLKYAWYDGSIWQTTIVDSTGKVGWYASLAVLPSGQPAISYLDSSNRHPKYAWYDGSTWQTTTVDSTWDVGKCTSLAILPSGHPAMSYYAAASGNNDLKYAWYDGTIWQTAIVDSTGDVGIHTSLTILPSGYPAISYQDWGNSDLKYAWYDGSTWHTTTVDSAGGVGSYTSLAILPSGDPAISYKGYSLRSRPEHVLKYAWYDGSAWRTTTYLVGPSNVGSLAILPSGEPGISCQYGGEGLKLATPAPTTPAPVAMAASYTATAETDLGGTTVVIDGPAYNEGSSWHDTPAWAESLVSFEPAYCGHFRSEIGLAGEDGEECLSWECFEWDPETGECLVWDCVDWQAVSCGDANGTVTGTIVLGTSESYPAGSDLDLFLEVLVAGDAGDAEDYHLQLWRGVSLLGQIDPCSPSGMAVPVFAGETLTFELFASEEDSSGDGQSYDRGFEFRLILRGPSNFDGKGTVDFRDYAIFALHWLDVGCSDPNWCGKADLDKSGDVNCPDLKIFTDHWLE